MNGTYRSRRGAVAWARSALRGVASRRGPRSRTQMIVAAAVATVLAVGVGIVWGIASATDQRVDNAGESFGDRQPLPGGTSGGALDGLASPGAVSGGGDPFGGSGSGAGSGAGPGSSGGPAGNRPPAIEDPGLSSDGLTLTIAPTVTDPDGDAVTVGYSVDGGQELSVTDEPTYRFTVDGVGGYRHEAEVTITATDTLGATTRQTFTHQLEAVSTVVVSDVRLTLDRPSACFAARPAQRLKGDLRLRGTVEADVAINQEWNNDKTQIRMLAQGRSGTVTGEPPRQDVFISNAAVDPDGATGSLSIRDAHLGVRAYRLFLDSPCQTTVRLRVQVTTQ